MRRLLPLAVVSFALFGCNRLTTPNEMIVADTSSAVKKVVEHTAPSPQQAAAAPAQPAVLPMPGGGG